MQSLCIHERIVRAFKHILQAVSSSVTSIDEMAVSVAAALNLMLGVHPSGEKSKCCSLHPLMWRWLKVFLKKRYEWDITSLNYKDVRKFAILRGLCQKVWNGRSWCAQVCLSLKSLDSLQANDTHKLNQSEKLLTLICSCGNVFLGRIWLKSVTLS